MDPHFDKKSRLFEQWFTKLPGTESSPNVRLVDFRSRNAGRGIVASVDTPKDVVLFTIPRTGILSTATSDLNSKLPDFFDMIDESESEDDDELPLESWAKLSLALIYEHFRGETSSWKPYLDIFPEKLDTPMFWSDSELSELQTSPLKSRIGKMDAEKLFISRVIPIIRKYSKVFFPDSLAEPSDHELVALCHRMGTIVMSYSFELENDDDDDEVDEDGWIVDKDGRRMLGMVPMADILNADAEFNAHVSHEEDKLVVTTIRAIKAGEEILNYYGPHPNSELVRQYGYSTEKHSRYDVVEIPWELVEAALKGLLGLDDQTWGDAIKKIDKDELESSFILERECDDVQSDGTFPGPAILCDVSSELVGQIKVMLKALRKVDPKLVPDKRKRDGLLDSVILFSLEKLANGYSTTVETDEKLLSESNLPHRLEMAVRVRLGEKILLQEAKALIRSRIESSDAKVMRV